jgi:hypothetical protein
MKSRTELTDTTSREKQLLTEIPLVLTATYPARSHYCRMFRKGAFGIANGQIPMVNMLDDHDLLVTTRSRLPAQVADTLNHI